MKNLKNVVLAAALFVGSASMQKVSAEVAQEQAVCKVTCCVKKAAGTVTGAITGTANLLLEHKWKTLGAAVVIGAIAYAVATSLDNADAE